MRILFGTIAKNIEHRMAQLLTFFTELQKELPDSHIFLYENNSTDNTCSYFPLFESMIQNLHIKSENIPAEELLQTVARTWDNKPCRMELIAMARNKLLDMIHSHGFDDDDLIVMFDADMKEPICMPPLLKILKNFPDADAIFANGLTANCQHYYDMYALRHENAPYGPEIRGTEFWDAMPRITIAQRTPVISAFGGLGIYKGYCLKHNSYSALPTKSLDQLYKSIMARHGYVKPIPETHYKGGLIGAYLFGEGPYDESRSLNPRDIFYVNNSGYSYPVVCEHSTFHATMTMRGQGRFFIDPELLYHSDH
jgi:hypothetical protein